MSEKVLSNYLEDKYLAFRVLTDDTLKRTKFPLHCSKVFLIRFWVNKDDSRWIGYFEDRKLIEIFDSTTILELAKILKKENKEAGKK